MEYEKGTLEAIVDARSKAMSAQQDNDMSGLGAAESMMRVGLGKLFALAENYPDLKANDSYDFT